MYLLVILLFHRHLKAIRFMRARSDKKIIIIIIIDNEFSRFFFLINSNYLLTD